MEAGSERGRRKCRGEEAKKEAMCCFTHWCRSRAPCKNSSGYVGHLECRVTSSACDCWNGAVRGHCAPSLRRVGTLKEHWRPRQCGREATDSRAGEQDHSWPHLTRRAPRGIRAQKMQRQEQLNFAEGVPFPL